ncbi:MAG: N-acetylglucosamine-6-phosphate deacetylase [Pirellulaceae bacterium]|jgi:N-acetylglucosamine-6-phosphate deacetylase
MKIRGRRYDTGIAVEVHCVGGKIAAVTAIDDCDELPWISPGWLDIQVNGFGGKEFSSATLSVDEVREVTLAMDSMGVTNYWPTLTTHSAEVLLHGLKTIARVCQDDAQIAARIGGIHIEGPYLSPEDGPRGAHPRQHCRPPNWTEFQLFQEAAGGLINLITLAPEWQGSAEFIARVVDANVVVAIGHTAANSDQIRAAVDAGATLSTHLGNGAHGTIRRHPNYIWDQLADDRLSASLIADGHHLPHAVLKSMVRAKTPARCILVSDITGMAGMPPGRYQSPSLSEVEVLEDGRLVVAGQRQYLAGAALPLGVGIATIARHTDASLEETIDMVCANPARLWGREPPSIDVESVADLVAFDLDPSKSDSLNVRTTVKSGELAWQGPAPGEST